MNRVIPPAPSSNRTSTVGPNAVNGTGTTMQDVPLDHSYPPTPVRSPAGSPIVTHAKLPFRISTSFAPTPASPSSTPTATPSATRPVSNPPPPHQPHPRARPSRNSTQTTAGEITKFFILPLQQPSTPSLPHSPAHAAATSSQRSSVIGLKIKAALQSISLAASSVRRLPPFSLFRTLHRLID